MGVYFRGGYIPWGFIYSLNLGGGFFRGCLFPRPDSVAFLRRNMKFLNEIHVDITSKVFLNGVGFRARVLQNFYLLTVFLEDLAR